MSKRGGPKRIDANPANRNNFRLVCSACGAEFENKETIALDAETGETHWSREHPELENPHFNMIWVGIGKAPKPNQVRRRR